MIDPRHQWAIQIDVTNACLRKCSNCTRLLAHVRHPFYMTVDNYTQCVDSLRDFPTASSDSSAVRDKVIGMIGGEPLLHPSFPDLVEVLVDRVPARKHRGLWTGVDWRRSAHAKIIKETFGYINNNLHDSECRHSPVLVAIRDVISDATERQRLIEHCWLQRHWSGSITPKGFFFCEVAAALDIIFEGPGGLPVEPGCWRSSLSEFEGQISRWCPRCGIPLNLKGRIDTEEVDDISPSNLTSLRHSPAVQAGKYVPHDGTLGDTTDAPWKYLQ